MHKYSILIKCNLTPIVHEWVIQNRNVIVKTILKVIYPADVVLLKF